MLRASTTHACFPRPLSKTWYRRQGSSPCETPPASLRAPKRAVPLDVVRSHTHSRANANRDLRKCTAAGLSRPPGLPLLWDQLDAHRWWMRLSCPDCDHVRGVVLDRLVLEDCEVTMERAFQRTRTAVDHWGQSAMQDWCELFGLALAEDGILPFDFH